MYEINFSQCIINTKNFLIIKIIFNNLIFIFTEHLLITQTSKSFHLTTIHHSANFHHVYSMAIPISPKFPFAVTISSALTPLNFPSIDYIDYASATIPSNAIAPSSGYGNLRLANIKMTKTQKMHQMF